MKNKKVKERPMPKCVVDMLIRYESEQDRKQKEGTNLQKHFRNEKGGKDVITRKY